MERTPEGTWIISGKEADTVALAISDRCDATLQWYRTTVESCGTAEYFAQQFNDACKLYKQFFGAEYPVDPAEGAVPPVSTLE